MTKRRSGGFTLIEFCVASFIAILIGIGLVMLVRSAYDAQDRVMSQNNVNASARQVIDALSDGWRTNPSDPTTEISGLRGATGLTEATAGAVTYTDPAGNTVRYWQSGSKLLRSVNGQPSTGAMVADGLATNGFQLTYWYISGSFWTSAGSVANASTVCAVDFAVNLSSGSSARKMAGSVRLRMK